MKSFYFHYNKPASQRAGSPKISVHYDHVCHIVENIVCDVPTVGKINKRSPIFVMKGKCKSLEIRKAIAYIS